MTLPRFTNPAPGSLMRKAYVTTGRITTSTGQQVQPKPIQETYRGFQVMSEPFRHEDDTFSLTFRILASGRLIHAGSRSSAEQGFTSAREASHAAVLLARDWIAKHTELWARRLQ